VAQWAVRARLVNQTLDQRPGQKNGFMLFSMAFTFCDPDYSFDGSYACEI
jgi:hypothetical protein